MISRYLITLFFILSGSVLPDAVVAQQPDTKPNESQMEPQNTPVQPERTPQQSDRARQQDNRNAEGTRINPDWTTRQGNDGRIGMDRPPRMDQGQDSRTVGRNWHRDYDELERSSRYRDEDRYYEDRPRRRIKTCVEYENGDEFCHYRD